MVADLMQGIRIDFQDGGYEVYRQVEPGLIRVSRNNPDGSIYEMDLAQGAHLVLFKDMIDGQPVDGGVTVTDYGMPITELPVPVPGGRWQAETTITDAVGTRNQTMVHAYDQIAPLQIAGCTYDAIGTLIAYQSEDNYIEFVQFFPDLGISYLEWNESDNFDRLANPALAISLVAK